jgi:hypothetical protein
MPTDNNNDLKNVIYRILLQTHRDGMAIENVYEIRDRIVSAVNATQRPASPLPSPERVATDSDHRIIDAISVALKGEIGREDDVERLLGKVESENRQQCLAQIAVAFIRWSQDLKLRARDAEHGATCKQSLQVAWTPAATPPTGTGWYVVLWRNGTKWPEHAIRDVHYWDGTDWRFDKSTPSCTYVVSTKAVAFWRELPPLPELPAMESK